MPFEVVCFALHVFEKERQTERGRECVFEHVCCLSCVRCEWGMVGEAVWMQACYNHVVDFAVFVSVW